MRSLLHGIIAVAVLALAFWAYQQNYATQAAVRAAEAERHEIQRLRERLAVLRAEWAYLNRPERLRDLANLNFDRLRLFPLAPEQFGTVAEIAYPAAPAALSDVIDLRAESGRDGE